MKISGRKIGLLFFLVTGCTVQQATTTRNSLPGIIRQNFNDASAQYQLMMKRLPAGRFPKTYYAKTDKFQTAASTDWCSGFYPGTLLYIYEQTKEQALLTEAEHILNVLEKEKNNKGTHDLGFMMYCSFGNAERIASKPAYKSILLTSAQSLASRFNANVGCLLHTGIDMTCPARIIVKSLKVKLLWLPAVLNFLAVDKK